MKIVVVFAAAAALMLVFVTVTSQTVGLMPMTPDIGSGGRSMHLWLVGASLTTVATVDAAVIWLALRRPPEDDEG